jgi:hypothetical protein
MITLRLKEEKNVQGLLRDIIMAFSYKLREYKGNRFNRG